MVAVVSAGLTVRASAAKPEDPCPRIDLKRFNGERFILQKPDQSSRHYTDLAIAYDHAEPGQVFLLENLESALSARSRRLWNPFNFYQVQRKNFHYPKPVRCFRIEIRLILPAILHRYAERKTDTSGDGGADPAAAGVRVRAIDCS